jgi:two-component system response regulator QseB
LAKILLVEDDEDLALTIADSLTRAQHTIDTVHDGLDGQELLRSGGYDVVILDWDLPGMTGVELLQFYRANSGTASVIMLTGRNSIDNKETGLFSGADDYLTKPFDLRELSARIMALLRRPTTRVTNTLNVRNINLDPTKHRVTKAGEDVKLTPKDFALLEFFMRHPDELFTVDTILTRVWPQDADISPEGLRVAIRRIRKALGEDSDTGNSIIENVTRIGYRLKP